MSFPTSSHPASIDDILFMVYVKVVSLVSHNRLTHWHNIDSFIALKETYDHPSDALDNWFSVPTPPLDLFKDELMTWRNISTYAPPSSLQASAERPLDEDISKRTVSVPAMTLDVILDPAKLAHHTGLWLVKQPPSSSPSSSHNPSPTAVPVENLAKEGERPGSKDSAHKHRPLILERWRVDFNAFPPDDPPTLDALTKQCGSLLSNLAEFSISLPGQRLYRRIRNARIQAQTQTTAGRSLTHDDLLQIGCRLGAGEPADGSTDDDAEEPTDEAEEIGLRVKLSLSRSSDAGDETEMETSIHGLNPVITPIGSINVSVEYRNNLDFFVRQRSDITTRVTPSGIASIDEDFFKPKHPRPPSNEPSPGSSAPSSGTPSRRVSALSVLRQQSSVAKTTSPLLAPSAPASSASSPAPSLFNTSQSSRPVAGLSSLRTPSSAPVAPMTDKALASGSNTSAISTSPVAAQPAFITHHRRPSMSERRFRTLSGLGSDRPSPPSPSSPSGAAPVRPALPPQMRFGSYSPSSPSPLAQQLSANPASQSQQRLPYSASYSGTALPSTSSTHRGPAGSPTFSLRAVFQDYGPQQQRNNTASRSSVSSISSLSATRGPGTSHTPQRPPVSRKVSEGEGGVSEDRSSSIVSGSGIGGVSTDSIVSNETSRDTSQVPTVAPRMIERYPRTPSYRLDRRRTSGSIGESEAEGTGAGRAGGSSGEGVGSGVGTGGQSLGSGSYSRSWQARTEARQAMIANAMNRGSLGSAGSGSPGSFQQRASPPVSGAAFAPRRTSTQTSSASPASSSSHRVGRKGSIDELVTLLENRPQLSSPRITKRPAPTPTQPAHPPSRDSPGLASKMLSGENSTSSSENLNVHKQRQQLEGLPSSIAASGVSITGSSSGVPTASRLLLSKSAVDDMLAKMSMTVSRLTAPQDTLSTDPPAVSRTISSTSDSQTGNVSPPGSDSRDVTVEGGRGARIYVQESVNQEPPRFLQQPGSSSGAGSTTGYTPPDGPASTEESHRQTRTRSRSSFELSSPDHALLHLQQRSSSGYGEPEPEGGLMANFDEEEPAGRLELHSEPSTPHFGNTTGHGGTGYLSDAFHSGRRHGSDGNDGNVQNGGIALHHLDSGHGAHIEGGLGGLGPGDLSDAERLMCFGEGLSSTRGRRAQSPWGVRRSRTPGVGGIAPSRSGQQLGGTSYGGFAMRTSQSHSRHLRGLSSRPNPGGHQQPLTSGPIHRGAHPGERGESVGADAEGDKSDAEEGEESRASSGPASTDTSGVLRRDW